MVNNTAALQTPPSGPIPTGINAYLIDIATGLVEKVLV